MSAVVHNPHDRPISDLPAIYAFPNGGQRGWLNGVILAEDGGCLGGHVSTNETWLRRDLGASEGADQANRTATFRRYYPDGYRVEYVALADVPSHLGLRAAIARNGAQDEDEADTAA